MAEFVRNFATKFWENSMNFLRNFRRSPLLITLSSKSLKLWEILRKFNLQILTMLTVFLQNRFLPSNSTKSAEIYQEKLGKSCFTRSGIMYRWSCTTWKLPQNEPLIAEIGVDTAENGRQKRLKWTAPFRRPPMVILERPSLSKVSSSRSRCRKSHAPLSGQSSGAEAPGPQTTKLIIIKHRQSLEIQLNHF